MNEQRTKVFLDRYALKDETGAPVEDSPEQMWDRVAKAIADTPEQEAKFRDALDGFKFVPGGRILAGAGTESEVTYYNCYVIPLESRERRELRLLESTGFNGDKLTQPDPGSDSREAILDTISVMVDIMSRGGGVGINWSVLRPKGAYLTRVNGHTSGPVSWMDVASHAVNTVTQGGSRRGAAMFMLDDWHPDLMEFINAKRDYTKITGANVSIAISDDFMAAVEADADWVFEFPDTGDSRYNTEWDGDLAGWKASGGSTVTYGTLPAREVWSAVVEAAHASGEPGVIFLARYNAQSTGRGVERIICVNPCGEQGLGPYSVCNLGSMNLDAYISVEKKDAYRLKATFDWGEFQQDVATAVEFLDNVIDKNYYFLPDNEAAQMKLRRIGLGVMGLADALIALGLRYGSPGAVEFTERVFQTMKTTAIRTSMSLAQQKGPAPAWDKKETWKAPYFAQYFYQDSPLSRQIRRHGLRNMFLLTQAPTGSTSILAGVNSGIEPYFEFKYTRVDRTGTHEVLAPAVEKYRTEGVTRGAEWVTSNDVTVEEHIAMQAAVQKFVDSSVSKTINGPNSHTVDDVAKAYTLAYQSGLKGLAYFRDGSGRDQVLYKEAPKQEKPMDHEFEESLATIIPYAVDYERPEVLNGQTIKAATRGGTAYVTVNRDGDRPVEVFFNVGKAGSELASMAEALGRLASLALRKGATLGGVANQLEGVGGVAKFNKPIPAAIGEALTALNRRAVEEATVPLVDIEFANESGTYSFKGKLESFEPASSTTSVDVCPDCHNLSLTNGEGCKQCNLCGYSAC